MKKRGVQNRLFVLFTLSVLAGLTSRAAASSRIEGEVYYIDGTLTAIGSPPYPPNTANVSGAPQTTHTGTVYQATNLGNKTYTISVSPLDGYDIYSTHCVDDSPGCNPSTNFSPTPSGSTSVTITQDNTIETVWWGYLPHQPTPTVTVTPGHGTYGTPLSMTLSTNYIGSWTYEISTLSGDFFASATVSTPQYVVPLVPPSLKTVYIRTYDSRGNVWPAGSSGSVDTTWDGPYVVGPITFTTTPAGSATTHSDSNVTVSFTPDLPTYRAFYQFVPNTGSAPTDLTCDPNQPTGDGITAQKAFTNSTTIPLIQGDYFLLLCAVGLDSSQNVVGSTGTAHPEFKEDWPPTNVTVAANAATSLDLAWTPPSPFGPVNAYQIEDLANSNAVLVNFATTSSQTTYHWSNPTPTDSTGATGDAKFVLGLASCSGTSLVSCGTAVATNPTVVYTWPNAPVASGTPATFSVNQALTTNPVTASIMWNDNLNSNATLYNVYLSQGATVLPTATAFPTTQNGSPSSTTSLPIPTTLAANTEYTYTVDALNTSTSITQHTTHMSAPVSFYTPTRMPPAPTSLTFSANATSFQPQFPAFTPDANTQYFVALTPHGTAVGTANAATFSSVFNWGTAINVSVPIGAKYDVYTCALPNNNSTNPEEFAWDQLTTAATDLWSYCSTTGYTFTSTFSAPTAVLIVNTPDVATTNTFRLRIKPVAAQYTSLLASPEVKLAFTDETEQQTTTNQIQAMSPDAVNGWFFVDVHVDSLNTKYDSISAAIGTSTNPNDPGWSAALPAVDPVTNLNAAYTLPDAPSIPSEASVTDTTMVTQLAIAADDNPPSTNYQISASNDPGDFTTDNPSVRSTPAFAGTPGTTVTQTLSGMTSGASYWLEAVSLSIFNHSYDVVSDTAGPFATAIPPGNIVSATTSTLTASWSIAPPSSVSALAAGATNSFVITPILGPAIPNPQTSPITLTALPLPVSNSAYAVFLEHWDNGSLTPSPYPDSTVWGVTTAAAPIPQLSISGTRNGSQGLYMDIGLGLDNNDPNSTYSIEVVPPTGSPYYLLGSGATADGAGKVCAVTDLSCPVFESSATWTSGNNNRVTNLKSLSATYKVILAVKQNTYPPTAPTSTTYTTVTGSTTIVTPGTVQVISYGPANVASPLAIDNVDFDVPPANAFQITFNSVITPQAAGTIQVWERTGTSGAYVPTQLQNLPAPTISTTNNESTVSIVGPGGTWNSNGVYYLIIPAGFSDVFGFSITRALPAIYFMTTPPSSGATVVSPLDNAGVASVSAAANVFANTNLGAVVTRVQFVTPAHAITAPSLASGSNPPNANNLVRSLNTSEVLFYPPSTSNPVASHPLAQLSTPVTLTLCENNVSQDTLRVLDQSSIGIYTQVGSPTVTRISPAGLNAQGCATAAISQSGVYYLAGMVQEDLDSSYAFPVPFRPASGHTAIKFTKVAPGATVKIYTIMGELVKQINADGSDPLIWNVKNDDGENVASGVYVYQIKDPYSEKRGKLIIIR